MDKHDVLADEWAVIWSPKKGYSLLVPQVEDESTPLPMQGLALFKIFAMLEDQEFVNEMAQAALEDMGKNEPT